MRDNRFFAASAYSAIVELGEFARRYAAFEDGWQDFGAKALEKIFRELEKTVERDHHGEYAYDPFEESIFFRVKYCMELKEYFEEGAIEYLILEVYRRILSPAASGAGRGTHDGVLYEILLRYNPIDYYVGKYAEDMDQATDRANNALTERAKRWAEKAKA